MKIAATYDNGEIFQHFGRTPAFKVYEVNDGAVTSSKVVPTNGTGHGALAGMLAELGVEVIICGGIGGGAQAALEAAGIRLFAGASGDPDKAVEMLLAGTLPEIGEANCDHHHGEGHEEHCCGHHEEGHEEHCCGHHEEDAECCSHEDGKDCGCGGGCCGGNDFGTGRNAGKTVRAHYRGTFNDGTQFDSSYDRGEPIEFICGAGMMIPGFDAAVDDMEVGEIKEVHLMPEEAYGEPDPEAIFEIEASKLAGSETLKSGQRIMLQTPYGEFPVKFVGKGEGGTIVLDANHEMAGKELNFTIELVEVQE